MVWVLGGGFRCWFIVFPRTFALRGLPDALWCDLVVVVVLVCDFGFLVWFSVWFWDFGFEGL